MNDLAGKRAAICAVAIAAALLLGALGVGFVRDYAKECFLKSEPPRIAPLSKADAAKWLDAVGKGDMPKALVLAAKAVPEPFEMPRPEYLGLISDCHVRLGFLTDSFNFADFIRWKDLCEMNALAAELLKAPSGTKPVKAVFEAVMARVANPSKEEARTSPPLSAMLPWRESKGNSSDRLRLLCGLATQGGCQCAVVGIFKNVGQVVRELCEIRKGSEVWLADTASGVLWEGLDARALASRPELLPKDWTEEERAAIRGPHVYFVPAEPQDFRRCSALLYERLSASGAAPSPELPKDPQTQLRSLVALHDSKGYFSYWRIPWMSLRSLKADPGGWLVDGLPSDK